MKNVCRFAGTLAAFVLGVATAVSFGQAPSQQTASRPSNEQIQQEVRTISADLATAEKQLQQSQQQVQRLQQQLAAIQAQLAGTSPQAQPPESAASPTPQENAEKIDVLQAEVKQHDQAKVESASKYPVRFTGLILFNSFLVKGSVDNLDLPDLAMPATPGASDLAVGASIRQTILGVQVSGPHWLGAESSGEVNLDFYGGIPYSNYNTVAGIVRMRTAAVRLNWRQNTAEVGFVSPLISPLEPTSYATVAEPAMAWAGNLWTWAPQLSYEHRFGSPTAMHWVVRAGLWDPPAAGYNANQTFRTASAGERSGQPAYESRIALQNGQTGGSGFQLGLGGYYSRQSFTGRSGDSWAVTTDWRVPVGNIFELSGEAYRGRSIGGLGGGLYKDIESGTDPATGASTFRLLNAGGGWVQTKFHLMPVLEANGAIGLDDGFTRDFHSLVLPAGASNTQLRARNRMATANLIYSPKTYLIFSPEYHRIWTWPIYGTRNTADIFTMSFGLRF